MIEKIKEIIVNFVDIEESDITAESKFIDDLGFSSYDFMSFLGEVEEEFDVEIDERKVLEIRTVGEAVDYLSSLK